MNGKHFMKLHELIDMSRFGILKKFTPKQINRVDKVVWETLKHTHIIE